MAEIGHWLEGLGLGQIASTFADAAIDLDILPEITEDDLEKLGIPLGHRKRLMRAIATLGEARREERPAAASATRPEAERRQLTLLFCDLVGSTELAARLDPEDLRAMMNAYQRGAAAVVERFEGHVAKYLGDGVLAYFGWPQAHEDDAERAVRAGLALVDEIARLEPQMAVRLRARVGIATGLVVVGDLIGDDEARERAVVGDVPNLAARLQALAAPGAVVISQATRRLVGALFELEDLGPVRLKGFAEPLVAFRVAGEGPAEGRFEALHGEHLTPLVGREKEQALLLQRWADARGGEGQAFLLIGEAGIGKSRLVRGLRDAISGEAHLEVRWQCSPFHGGTPLQPVLQSFAGEPSGVTLAALEHQFAESGIDKAEGVPLLAAAMGLASTPQYPMPDLSPEAQRSRLLSVLVQHLHGLATRRPLLVVLEDAHWADATTLELFSLLAGSMASSAILSVMTSRPEGLPPMPNLAHVTRLTLGRLGRAAVAAIVASTMSGQAAASLIDDILSRTDGIPLFVEELSKAVAERGSALVHADGTFDLPASLYDTLMARLDRLPGQKQVAQIAACIGREFDFQLLAAIAEKPETELRRGLEQLCGSELLYCCGTAPDARYRFKHALVREAAYESLLRSHRRSIHARVVKAIEDAAVPAAAEETAEHAAAAGLWGKALHYFGVAGKAALDRAANAEGLDLTAKAIAAGQHLAGDTQAQVAMIDLHMARGWAYLPIGDITSLMTELELAEASAARFGLGRLACEISAQRAHVETVYGGTIRRAVRYGREAARIAGNLENSELSAVARLVLGLSFLFAGEYRSAVAELMVDAAAYQHGLRMVAVGTSGTVAVDGLAVLGDALGHLGRWDEALARGAEAQTVAAETANPWDMHIANYHLARTLLVHGDAASALPLITGNIEFGKRCGFPMVVEWSHALLGQAYLQFGQYDQAIQSLDRAIAGCTEMQLVWGSTLARLAKAETELAAGMTGAAATAEETLRFARRHGYKAFEAGACRVLALCLRALDPGGARRYLSTARAIALKREMMPELKAIEAAEALLGSTVH